MKNINLRTKLSAFFLFLTVVACSANSSNKILKVMSYNIHIASPPSILPEFSHTDLKAIADVINREKPDLIALQEVDAYTERSGKHSHQAKDLAELTDMYYFFAKAIDRSDGDYGVAILSKYPIVDSESFKLPTTEASNGETRALAVIKIEALGEKLVFMSVHLDHRSDIDRQFQAKQLLEYTKPFDQYPIILAGDFNMEPNNDIFQLLLKRFVMETVKPPFTFSSTQPEVTIDHILINKKAYELFDILNYYTIDEKYASDHLPLVMELQIKQCCEPDMGR